MNLAH